ncbi:protein FAM134B [Platysternon megacephalum]|uniref:Protein FAM134B n=1 Tax=Platysternon megacephalum TaxID=55544 RepID=A0A4D9EPQ1_9SAUR|nr:protein FAM134B [Platysternon megacephalum]
MKYLSSWPKGHFEFDWLPGRANSKWGPHFVYAFASERGVFRLGFWQQALPNRICYKEDVAGAPFLNFGQNEGKVGVFSLLLIEFTPSLNAVKPSLPQMN